MYKIILSLPLLYLFVVVRPSPITSQRLGRQTTAIDVMGKYGSQLQGKTAIVTGGNSGIGFETCKALANEGVRVILCSRNMASGEKARLNVEKKENIVVVSLVTSAVFDLSTYLVMSCILLL